MNPPIYLLSESRKIVLLTYQKCLWPTQLYFLLPRDNPDCWQYRLTFSWVQFSRQVGSDYLWTAALQASLSLTISPSLPKFMSIESWMMPWVMPSNHLILCHPFLLLPSIFLSIMVFSNESALPIRWPTYWSFSFSVSSSNDYSVLISFRIDWLDLLVF